MELPTNDVTNNKNEFYGFKAGFKCTSSNEIMNNNIRTIVGLSIMSQDEENKHVDRLIHEKNQASSISFDSQSSSSTGNKVWLFLYKNLGYWTN